MVVGKITDKVYPMPFFSKKGVSVKKYRYHNVLFAVVTIDHPCMSLCSCHFRNGRLEVVKFLLTNTTVTADVNAKDGDGWTPLHHACR